MKQLNENVSLKTEEVVEQHRHQSDKIKSKLDDEKDSRERGLSDIERRRKSENADISIKFDIEFKILKQKFDKIREETNAKFDNECQQFNQKCDKIEESLLLMQEKLDDSLRNLTTATELLKSRKTQKLSEISEYCNQIIKKYENFISTTSSILAAEVDWTDVRCIPDLNSAWEVLIEEMKSEFPDIESLSVADTSHIADVIFDYIAIAEHEEKVLKGFLAKGWKIYGITTSGDSIIITGSALEGQSHITVCNKNGKIKRQDCIKSEALQGLGPVRCCSNLTESKVAKVCQPDEIGIYDIRDGSYKKKLISEITDDWLDDQSVFCVTTDPVNNNIIVGTDSRYVYIFDDQLNYKQTLLLPDVITAPHEITVHEGNLLVCDDDGEKAYAVTMQGSGTTVVYQFTPPDQEKDGWSPCSVCTDQNKFIYMVWSCKVSDRPRDVLVQYSQEGKTLLAIKEVYGALWVSALSETLLIATTKKIYMYGLKVT